jgi:hypothetical protein
MKILLTEYDAALRISSLSAPIVYSSIISIPYQQYMQRCDASSESGVTHSDLLVTECTSGRCLEQVPLSHQDEPKSHQRQLI